MQRFGTLWFVFAGLATLQAVVALALLYWGLPLFFDQPLLANGVSGRARELNDLLAATSNPSPRLAGMGEHYRWLFWRHIEGIEASLLASATLMVSSVATWVLLLVQQGAHRSRRDANDA